jgi:hypothetical protein
MNKNNSFSIEHIEVRALRSSASVLVRKLQVTDAGAVFDTVSGFGVVTQRSCYW